MAEPLTIQFQADTSRAQSAMATLAASVIGNVTSMAVAMQGGAANSNGFGAALSGLAQNASRAAAAVGADATKITTDTLAAATKQGATLEGIVRAATAAAVSSNTAQAGVRAGLTGTSTAISTLVAQVPSLATLVTGFLAFEAAKLVIQSVSASIDEARRHVEDFVRIGRQASEAGVSTSFFQRYTSQARELGLETQALVEQLSRANAAAAQHIGEGKGATNASAIDDRLEQNVRAGNLNSGDRAAYQAATTQEARIRVVLDLIDKLKAESRDLAAFDLAGKMFGPTFEAQLRQGIDAVAQMREALNSTAATSGGQRIVSEEEVVRAQALSAKLIDIQNTFAQGLAPFQKDFSDAALGTYDTFLSLELALARIVKLAGELYTNIKDVADQASKFVNGLPVLGTILKYNPSVGDVYGAIGRQLGLVDGEVQGPNQPLSLRVGGNRTTRPDRSAALPSLRPGHGTSGSESLDAVESLINQLEKARDVAKAELDNVGKTNVEREKAVDLAKAEAAARAAYQRGDRASPTLTGDERGKVLAAAEATAVYQDRQKDLEQQLRATAQTARYFGDAVASGLGDAIFNGAKFSDVLRDLESQLGRSALHALFTGQGPLASLLGTAPAASGGSDAVGGLAGLFTGKDGLFGTLFRANGGEIRAGQPYTVGEMGRELFIPNQNGRMVPIERGAPAPAAAPAARPLTVQMAVQTPDAPSFLRSEAQVTAALARAVRRGARSL